MIYFLNSMKTYFFFFNAVESFSTFFSMTTDILWLVLLFAIIQYQELPIQYEFLNMAQNR